MTGFLWNFAAFLIALGLLVAVHEFGHFWVARRCGVKVEKFSIGFGKSIWNRTGKDGTEYSLSVIPLGGYVKMLDGREGEVSPQEQQFAFDKKPLWKRTAIVAAGPVFNFLFAIVAYWLVFLIGVPAVKPVIGEVAPASIAAEAGLQPGMELKSIDGVKTPDWESVNMGVIAHIGDPQMRVTVAPVDEFGIEQTKVMNLSQWRFDPEKESAFTSLGFTPFAPEISTRLISVADGSAGEAAGLQVGDRLIGAFDDEITSWKQVVELIQTHPEQSIPMQVERDGEVLTLTLVPGLRNGPDGKVIGFAGIAPEVAEWPQSYRFELQFGVFESIGKAIDKTGQVIGLTITMLKKLIVGDVGLDNLSGPISIAKGAGTTADYGLVYFLGFLALISVNLGIINLVPLPMLDGGHLMFYAIEAVIRRPVPDKIQEIGYRIGGAIIFSLMLVALFNDFARL
ncbi:sigma E protease regulator RseP [Vibrio sp.]|uniref:sigma E protease regulator RseP n=1 Tax=Vibrio sp. TaxID=678 RepID=UPI003D13160E